MPESFGQKLRTFLDLPLHKKGVLFGFLFPILLIFSLIIHVVSLNRRKKSYPKLSSLRQFQNFDLKNIKIICVGNILIGGTGKSPVVQKIAQTYLSQGFIVAIAARGVGSNIKSIYFCNKNSNHDIEFLSDENREHAELLHKYSNEKNIFYVLQNKSRLNSLYFFLNELSMKNDPSLNAVLILDDGLQHFACPRNINICLWSPHFLLESPPYPMPIGPYREGFGKQSFQHLLNAFHYRFWSRTKEECLQNYQVKMKEALSKYDLEPNEKDILVVYNTVYFDLAYKNNKVTIGNVIKTTDLKNTLTLQTPISIITGIANPKNFMNDLKEVFNVDNIKTIFLDDHAKLNQKALALIQNSRTIILTLKDVFRWCQDPTFLDLIKEKNIIACAVAVSFKKVNNEEVDFSLLIKY